jgi:hypothetical protein
MALKRRLLLGAAVLVLAGAAWGQERPFEQIVVPLTRPDRPGKLVLERHQGSISVTGYEGAVVLVKASFQDSPESTRPDKAAAGMKPISAASIQLDAQEAENVVTVDAHSRSKSVALDIFVPFRFSVKLGVQDDGDVVVNGLTGDVEVDNPNGHVRLDRLTGSANVNTVDGDITVTFQGVAAGLPLALTTVHGKIDATFPADADLTVRMKSNEGMVYSDFDIAVEKRKTRTEPSAKTGGTRIALEEWTTGRIGRGGTDVLLKSFDGNIYIRKAVKSPAGHNLFWGPLY